MTKVEQEQRFKNLSFPNLECSFPEANKTLDNVLDNEMQHE